MNKQDLKKSLVSYIKYFTDKSPESKSDFIKYYICYLYRLYFTNEEVLEIIDEMVSEGVITVITKDKKTIEIILDNEKANQYLLEDERYYVAKIDEVKIMVKAGHELFIKNHLKTILQIEKCLTELNSLELITHYQEINIIANNMHEKLSLLNNKLKENKVSIEIIQLNEI